MRMILRPIQRLFAGLVAIVLNIEYPDLALGWMDNTSLLREQKYELESTLKSHHG